MKNSIMLLSKPDSEKAIFVSIGSICSIESHTYQNAGGESVTESTVTLSNQRFYHDYRSPEEVMNLISKINLVC